MREITEEEFENMTLKQKRALLKEINEYIDFPDEMFESVPLEDLLDLEGVCVLTAIGEPFSNFGYAHKEFMVDDPQIVECIKKDGLAPGSIVYTSDLTYIWLLDGHREWIMLGSGGGIPGGGGGEIGDGGVLK